MIKKSWELVVKTAYLETISLIERLHRQCLEVVKAELDRIGVRDLRIHSVHRDSNIGGRAAGKRGEERGRRGVRV